MKQSTSKSSQKKRRKLPNKPRLQVVATRGSITQVTVPVVVVGNYRGIAPLSATKALDDGLNHWISRAGEQGMIGAGLGEVFFIPVMNKEHKGINADAVLLAGMGEYGKFTYHDLRYLAMNICYAVSALKINGFASVAIGSGEGGIEIEEAVKGLLSGICDALHHVNPEERISEFRLVEYDKTRYRKMVRALKELIDNKLLENIDLKLTEEILPAEKRKTGGRSKSADKQQEATRFVNRITIERGEEGYSFSALTNSAVVPVRKVNVQPFFTEGIATQLRKGNSQERFGLLLHKYIFPEDFERMIDDGKSLTLVVDGATAALPWEMACYGPKQNRSYFGRDLKLTRQFRTMLSGAPGIAPPINESLRILVIADPASDNDLRLPGALREGEQVVQILQKFQKQLARKLEIEIVSCIGPEQCDPVEILALILNETFESCTTQDMACTTRKTQTTAVGCLAEHAHCRPGKSFARARYHAWFLPMPVSPQSAMEAKSPLPSKQIKNSLDWLKHFSSVGCKTTSALVGQWTTRRRCSLRRCFTKRPWVASFWAMLLPMPAAQSSTPAQPGEHTNTTANQTHAWCE
jgi:hypothetical protein